MMKINGLTPVWIGFFLAFSASLASAQTGSLRVSIARFTNFTETDRLKADQAIQLIEQVINSDEFQNRVLSFSYTDPDTGETIPGFYQNNGLSNAEILKAIYDGAESYNPVPNNQMDLNITLFKPGPGYEKVLGYTYPDSDTIWINENFYHSSTPADIAMNMTHEWTHKLGFDHDFEKTPLRPFSVPYAIGYMIQEMSRKFR